MIKTIIARLFSPLPLREGLGVVLLLLMGSASLQAQGGDPFGEVDIYKYSGSMTITSQVIMNGNVVTNAVVAVYCENELREKKSVGSGTNPNLVFLTVHGDYTGGYQFLYFKVYTDGHIFTYHPDPAIDFEAYYSDAIGTASNPYIIDITPVSLANDADNTTTLTTYKDETCNIALTGRTLYKDGNWNTLCLPFPMTAEQIATTDLAGATIMELDATGTYADDKGDHQTGFDAASGTLYLYFKSATSIEAGKPYIVKWTSGSDIANPVFPGVTVTGTPAGTAEAKNSGLNTVQFIGTYSPTPLTPNDKSNLFLGTGNTLYYPNGANNADGNYDVNACRAYFHVDLDGSAGVRAFVLNFDEEETGIKPPSPLKGEHLSPPSGGWGATLSGVRLAAKPTARGLYIYNGRKVMIN